MDNKVKLVSYVTTSESDAIELVNELNELFGGVYFKYMSWVDDIVYRIEGHIDRDKIEGTDIMNDFSEEEDWSNYIDEEDEEV